MLVDLEKLCVVVDCLLAALALDLQVLVEIVVDLALRRLPGVEDGSHDGKTNVRRRNVWGRRENWDCVGKTRCRRRRRITRTGLEKVLGCDDVLRCVVGGRVDSRELRGR